MRKFAGTFHRNAHGDWVKCMTEGGMPCSRHAGGEHIAGADLESALATLHEDDDFGMSAVADDDGGLPQTLGDAHASSMGHASAGFKHGLGDVKPSGGMIDDPPDKKPAPKKKVVLKKTKKSAVASKHEVSSVKHQEPVGAIDGHHPIDITGRPEYHYDPSANIHSVADALFPGVEKSYDIEVKLARQSNTAWKKITVDERASILDFTGSGYEAINGNLIGKKSVALVDAEIDDIHHGLSESKTKQDMIVYRRRYMTSDNSSRSGEERAYYQALADHDGLLGKPNFSSTTVAPAAINLDHTRANDTVYVIKVPKGTPAIYLGDKAPFSEHEFLLDKGLTYKVVGVYERGRLEKDSIGNESWVEGKAPVIALEIIPSEKPKKRKAAPAKKSGNANE